MTQASPQQGRPPAGAESSRGFAWSHWLNTLGPILGMVGIFLFFHLLIGSSFATYFNIQTILRQSTVTCMAALGATFIIISAGIDLSAGSAVALCAMVVVTLLKMTFADPSNGGAAVTYLSAYPVMWPLFCALAGVAVGALTGLLNGMLITGLRLVPFIVTLGTMMIFRGLTEAISVVAVNAEPNILLSILKAPDLPQWVVDSPARAILQWIYLAPGIWITLACAIVMAVILKFFRFGRYTTAIGSNEQTARLCGIPIARTKIWIYLVGGLFIGAAGVMQYARQQQGSPSAALGLELDVIAAVVIGGASLNGGKGSIIGTIVGSLIMTIIASGCSQVPIPASFPNWIGEGIGLQPFVQKIVTGMIIILAVYIDMLRQRRPE